MSKTITKELPVIKSENEIKLAIARDYRYALGALKVVWEELNGTITATHRNLFEKLYNSFVYKKETPKAKDEVSLSYLKRYRKLLAKHGGIPAIRTETSNHGYMMIKKGRLYIMHNTQVREHNIVNRAMSDIRTVRKEKQACCWSVRLSIVFAEIFLGLGMPWEVSDSFYEWYQQFQAQNSDLEIKGIKLNLREFQKEGVHYVHTHNGRALIADEQGLGKTVEALAYATSTDSFPVVIVCPATLKLNWEREIKHSVEDPGTVEVLSGTRPTPITSNPKYVIVNYDVVNTWAEEIQKIKPELLIVDEATHIKNTTSRAPVKSKKSKKKTQLVPVQKTAGTLKIGAVTPKVIGLSGTPIENRVIEFFNILNLIDSNLYSSQQMFGRRWCDLKKGRMGWDWTGSSNTLELNRVLNKSIMIRRKKRDVLKELPPIVRQVVPIEMDEKYRKEYDKAEQDFKKYLKDEQPDLSKLDLKKKSNALTQTNKLKQITMKGKIQSALNWIEEFIQNDTKLVCFTYHRETIDKLTHYFNGRTAPLEGGMSAKQKDESIYKFQRCAVCGVRHNFHGDDKNACSEYVPDLTFPLAPANIIAAAEGITLTAANNSAMLEYQWNPAKLSQAESRIHRISQTKQVNVFYLAAHNTIEEYMINMLDSKMKVSNEIIDGESDQGLNLGNALKGYFDL